MKENIFILPFDLGPFFCVTPGMRLSVEAIQLKIVNLLPFRIVLENLDAMIAIDGTEIGRTQKAPRLAINAASVSQLSHSQDLTDNQATIVRDYPSGCPQFKMYGTFNFTTPLGDLPVQFHVVTPCFVYKQ